MSDISFINAAVTNVLWNIKGSKVVKDANIVFGNIPRDLLYIKTVSYLWKDNIGGWLLITDRQ